MKFVCFLFCIGTLVACRTLHRSPNGDAISSQDQSSALGEAGEASQVTFQPSKQLTTLLSEIHSAVQFPAHKLRLNPSLCEELLSATRSITLEAKILADDWDRPNLQTMQYLHAFGHCKQDAIKEVRRLLDPKEYSMTSAQGLKSLQKAWTLAYYSSPTLRPDLEKSLGEMITLSLGVVDPDVNILTAIASKTLAIHGVTASYTVLRLWWGNENLSKYTIYYIRSMGSLEPKKATQDFLQFLSAEDYYRKGMPSLNNYELMFILSHLRQFPPTLIDNRTGVLFLLATSSGKIAQLAMNALLPLIEKQPEQMANLYASQPQQVRDDFLISYGNQGPRISQSFLNSLRSQRL